MNRKLVIILVLALAGAMVFSAPAYAASPEQTPKREQAPRLLRERGVVVSVDVNATTLVFKPARGAELTLTADEKTRFAGAAASLSEIKPGMQAAIAAFREEGGVVRLVGIITRVPPARYLGVVKSVDTAAGTLTITNRQGEELTFTVDENTRFKGRNIEVESLEDIQPGMWVGILAIRTDEGLLARGILAASREDLPKLDVRMGGKVIAVGADSFTIENRNGEEVTFQVDENTRFRSRVGNVTKLHQLKEGMLVMVGGQALEDGSFLAKVVLVVERKP